MGRVGGRGQLSLEYLVIIGVAIAILIPGVLFFYSYSQSNTQESVSAQFNDAGLRIVTAVKSTYALGTGARETVEFVMPDDILRAYVNGTELIFLYDTPQGQSEAVFFSIINITTSSSDGNISTPHSGLTKYRMTSTGQAVFINETA